MPDEGNDILLTDLCAICHINPIKYTCPRCGIHTCSLPCVKRHKSWAQCSGVRDPTAYRKRADLATPASIDQDFNFITSVERSLQRADALSSINTTDLAPSGLRRDRKSKFDSAIEERGIRLIKAPKGLSRNKQNKSHWAGESKGVAWTTEWIHYDGRKRNTIVFESSTVGEAFQSVFARKPMHSQKRKRGSSETESAPVAEREVPSIQANGDSQISKESVEKAQDVPLDIGFRSTDPTPVQSGAMVEHMSDNDQTNMRQRVAAQPLEDIHYYLFKPNTTSKVKCLIPVAADSKLVDVLRNQTLLEFPTLYIRREAPEALPEPFVAEAKYNELYGLDVSTNVPTYAPDGELEEGEVVDLHSIDEKKVLEVLQKDLNG
ncbi:hypothetical protein G647_07304 [Cladophialophora carrionii CBS 160.54]|uniref:Box C/D snoRNA protein 1 n=1 Tax=Cladophialophora carrionii CBS 160.54 TaxID=1279043 RepID=V9D2W2_9EURO|nr:uncharacterized protein G647_07304 [Cladophialophora carrionii CBS 160.54]ETI20961.1 hypothetical protein G647_07304 [Cladophialophora carrionii CBS 160.54]